MLWLVAQEEHARSASKSRLLRLGFRRMKSLFLISLAMSVLLGSSANAADLTRPAVVYPTTTVAYFTWTGCYLGGNGGGLRAYIT